MLNLVTCFHRWRLKNMQAAIGQEWFKAGDAGDIQTCSLHMRKAQQLEKKKEELRYKLGEIPRPISVIPLQLNNL